MQFPSQSANSHRVGGQIESVVPIVTKGYDTPILKVTLIDIQIGKDGRTHPNHPGLTIFQANKEQTAFLSAHKKGGGWLMADASMRSQKRSDGGYFYELVAFNKTIILFDDDAFDVTEIAKVAEEVAF